MQSASNTRLRVKVFCLAMTLCILCMVGITSIIFTPTERMTLSLRTVELPELLFTTKLGYHVTDMDRKIYEQAFRFQDAANWKAADKVLANVSDTTLIGAVMAERYLHEDYTSTYEELSTWLKAYGDMPQAPRILALARQKQPAGAELPTIADLKPSLNGAGLRDGIHGEAMPAHWKAGLAAWGNGRYGDAARIFSGIANQDRLSPWHRSASHYWAYRAYSRLNNSNEASRHLQRAADHPFTLYGLLAAHQLDYAMTTELPDVDAATLDVPAVKRAIIYNALGRSSDAEAELRALYPRLPETTRRQLATVASQLNLPALQIRIAQAGKDLIADTAAYPAPAWIAHESMQADPSLVFAIARQESAFLPQSRNPYSGASGVMQLMPSTARYVIRQFHLDEIKVASLDVGGLGAKPITADRLHDPIANMTIGQHYINYLAGKPFVNGNLIHMLAAYNAGPAHLISWQERFADIEDPLLFMEMIPFRETRHYVKQVMANYIIYRQMLADDTSAADALAQGKWPTVTVSETPVLAVSSAE
jgi:soluble lytic murein transglycosylase-like protein